MQKDRLPYVCLLKQHEQNYTNCHNSPLLSHYRLLFHMPIFFTNISIPPTNNELSFMLSIYWFHNKSFMLSLLLRLVICNRLVNLGISKQQHLYLKTEFNLKTQT